MDREHVAIYGTENPNRVTRIELVLAPDGNPELLHSPEGGGRYARVIRAVVAGSFPRQIAFKLERDTIKPNEGAVKFVSEYRAQMRAHQDPKDDRTRVVRVFEMSPLPAGRDCDELPPTLICPRSRQILAPRCPCGRAELPNGLRCPTCGVQQSPAQVLAASGCPRCAAEGSPCKAFWLNARTCKLLLLELLDLNLDDYVAWRWSPPSSPPPNRPAWQKFQEHLSAGTERERQFGLERDPVTKEFDELRFLLNLFADALSGVRELHAKSIAHLDLKPANLCLALEGASAKLKVIDLGQAHGPNTPWPVWYQSVFDDAASTTPGSLFQAPEQMASRFVPIDVYWRQSGDIHYLVVPPGAKVPASVLSGDLYCFPSDRDEPFLRVIGAQPTAAGYEIKAASVGSGQGQKGRGEAAPGEWLAGGCLVHQAGFAADLFSLGMLLAHLVARGKLDLAPTRHALDDLDGFLKQTLSKEAPLPARAAVHALSQVPNRALTEPWQRFLASMPEDRQLREITRELLGMALRAIVRGVRDFSYAQDRSADRTCLDDFLTDLQTVRNRLAIHFQSHDLHAGRVARMRRAGLTKLREWLQKQSISSTDSKPPPYDREYLCCTLDMLANNKDRNEREFRLLQKHYRMAPGQLGKDLDLFEKELNANLVCARQVHPVVLALFEVSSPPRNKKRESRAVAEFKSCQNKAGQLLAALRAFLTGFDNAKSRAFLVESDMRQVRMTLEEFAALLVRIEAGINQLTAWQARFYKRQYGKIVGWDRLDFAGMEEWQRFGNRCWILLSGEVKKARRWAARAGDAQKELGALILLAREELVNTWATVKKNYAWTVRGFLERALAMIFRREATTRVVLTSNQIGLLNEHLAAVEKWLKETQAVPFADRLADATKASTVPR